MPRIELIPEVYYDALNAYHYLQDNLPLQTIYQRELIMNLALDINTQEVGAACGSAGSLANRLDQSINDNGSLKTSAMDEPEDSDANVVYHSIGAHTDGLFDDGSGSIEYVRMLGSERDKLDLIADEATDITFSFETISTTVSVDSGVISFSPSSTITVDVVSPNTVSLHTVFPATAAHEHHYDITPYHEDPGDPDYQNYTTPAAVAFVDGSLRVYVNGVRVGATSVYVPPYDLDGDWTLTSIASYDETTGDFALNRALDSSDIIRIDFDVSLA